MLLYNIECSGFTCSGNAMFDALNANVWQKFYAPHTNLMCQWALRSLLVDDGEHLVLIDTGFGASDPQQLASYGVDPYLPVATVLKNQWIDPACITHVLLTHLHLDHCGGAMEQTENNSMRAAFPNAQFIVGKEQLRNAQRPSAVEQSAFQTACINFITTHKNVQFIENDTFIFPWLEVSLVNGHTQGLLVPTLITPKANLVFATDLIPTAAHLNMNSASQFDTNPLMNLAERELFLESCDLENTYFFLQHDSYHECCSIKLQHNSFVVDAYHTFDEIRSILE